MKLRKLIWTGMLLAAAWAVSVQAAPLTEQVLLERCYMNDYDQEPYIGYGYGHYENICLDDAGREQWSELDGALRAFSEENSSSVEAYFAEACEGARMAKEGGYEYQVTSESKILVRRADESVFSFLVLRSDYTGGAHGYYFYTGYNYDPSTGQELTLADIFTDEAVLKDTLWQLLLEKYPDSSIGTFCDNLDDFGTGPEHSPLNWTAGPQGVTFIFNPYDIASYAEGVQTVTLPYAGYTSLYTGRIGASSGSYTCALFSYMDEDYDVDGDGFMDRIYTAMGYSQEGMASEYMTVSINGKACTFDIYGYEYTPMLMHTEDGRTYLYLETLEENDYRLIEVIELTGAETVHVGRIEAGFCHEWSEEAESAFAVVPLNPMHFRLESRMHMLSTYDGVRYYTMADGSMGTPETDLYEASLHRSLTTVKELPVHLLDTASMTVSDDITYVPAGETVTIWETDGETFADLYREDGTAVRLYVDTSGYPRLIEGEDEQDFFEMLFYAG